MLAIFIKFLISYGLNLVLRKGEVYRSICHIYIAAVYLHMPEQATYQKADRPESC
jgi:hypothetical protein